MMKMIRAALAFLGLSIVSVSAQQLPQIRSGSVLCNPGATQAPATDCTATQWFNRTFGVVNKGVLVTSNTGVPSISTDPTISGVFTANSFAAINYFGWDAAFTTSIGANPSTGTMIFYTKNTQTLRLSSASLGAIEFPAYSNGYLSTVSGLVTSSTSIPATGISWTPPGTGAVATTVASVLNRTVNVMNYGAVCNGTTDDYTAFARAVTYLTSLGGGTMEIPNAVCRVRSKLPFANIISVVAMGPLSQVLFDPVDPTTDFALFWVNGPLGNAHPVTGAVALGATSITVTSPDASDVTPGDWIILEEADDLSGVPYIDIVRVLSVTGAGTKINLVQPTRMAFPNTTYLNFRLLTAQDVGAGIKGLIITISGNVVTATGTCTNGSATITGISDTSSILVGARAESQSCLSSVGTVLSKTASTVVLDTKASASTTASVTYSVTVSALYSSNNLGYRMNGVTVNGGQPTAMLRTKNQWITGNDFKNSVVSGNEYAASVDWYFENNITSGGLTIANAGGITANYGSAFCRIVGNTFGGAANVAIQLIHNTHNCLIADNIINYLGINSSANAIGIYAAGASNNIVRNNILLGGDGASSKGMSFASATFGSETATSANNDIFHNRITGFAAAYDTMLSTDNYCYLDGSGNTVCTGRLTQANLSLTGTSMIFQSAGVTGTLAWAPSSTNKTITLPNGTTDFTATSGVLQQATAGAAITAGTVGGSFGGTGVNNGASTITIGGNVTFSGGFTFTGTISGNTSVTFPTSGTLATTAGASIPAIAQGDLLYGSASNVLSALAKDTGTSRFLKNSGTSNNPAWARPACADLSDASAMCSSTDVSNLTGILGATHGGTGNAFFAVTGPTTTTRTFTFPNANATILSDNAVVTGAQGGTGVANSGLGITLGGNLTTSGANALTLTTTGTTNSTLPVGTHTLAGLDVAQVFTAAQTFTVSGSQQLNFNGYSVLSAVSNTENGSIRVGGAVYQAYMDYNALSAGTTFTIANYADFAAALINFTLRNSGTPVVALSLDGSGNATSVGVIRANLGFNVNGTAGITRTCTIAVGNVLTFTLGILTATGGVAGCA